MKDAYYGAIARAELYIDGNDRKPEKARQELDAAIHRLPGRGEAYIKLW